MAPESDITEVSRWRDAYRVENRWRMKKNDISFLFYLVLTDRLCFRSRMFAEVIQEDPRMTGSMYQLKLMENFNFDSTEVYQKSSDSKPGGKN